MLRADAGRRKNRKRMKSVRPLSLKISVSGVRGIVGESLTPQIVTSFAAAFGTYSGAGPILVGTDTRPSAEMVKQAVFAGLLSVGCAPVDLGIVPLPCLMFHVREVGAFGGISISASHNPMEWNALKFVGPDGIVLRPHQVAELTDLYHQGVFPRVGARDMAEVRADRSSLERHRKAILRVIDIGTIQARRPKVVVDCCNGAASAGAPEFLRALGCEVVELYTDVRGLFPRPPEPLPENIGDLCQMVVDSEADVGFALDADGDRLAIVSECGEPLGDDCTFALAAAHWLRRNPGPVVASVATSRMIDDIAERYGCPVHRTRVGEIHVVQKMLDCGAEIGGEGNGGVILSRVHPCRDSFTAMGLVLEALAQHGGSMSELRSEIPTYTMVTERLICPARDMATCLRLLRDLYKGERLDLTDGLKVIRDDGWLLARPSSTEPILRLYAEATSEEKARALMREVLDCLSPQV